MQEYASRLFGWITEPGLLKSPLVAFFGLSASWASVESIMRGACLVMTTAIIGIQCYHAVHRLFKRKPPKTNHE